MLIVLIIIAVCVPLFYFVIKANNKYWERQKQLWEPHRKAVNGEVRKKYHWSGNYNGVPVSWRLYSSGGGGGENSSQEYYYLELYLQFPAGGKKWKLSYNVPGLLNHRPEGWTIKAKDAGLENVLTQAGIKDLAATLPRYCSVRYNDKNGRLVCEYQVNGMSYVQPLGEFNDLVRVLEQMGNVNQGVKGTVR